jgi:hypothetical protein
MEIVVKREGFEDEPVNAYKALASDPQLSERNA